MDYNEYYDNLLAEVERTAVMLKGYDELDEHFSNVVSNRVTYESYVLSSLPVGIPDIVYILTSGSMSITFEFELRNTLKHNTRWLYTKKVLEMMKNNKEQIIDIFKSLTGISNSDLLNTLKLNIANDLDKNEDRLARLRQLSRR